MYCRSRPQYRSDLGWILGVAFLGTLTRSARPAQGFTYVRCCSAPRLLPHTASRRQAGLSRDAPTCVQLPSACGCFQLAPQRTCTSNPGSMPGTPRRPLRGAWEPATVGACTSACRRTTATAIGVRQPAEGATSISAKVRNRTRSRSPVPAILRMLSAMHSRIACVRDCAINLNFAVSASSERQFVDAHRREKAASTAKGLKKDLLDLADQFHDLEHFYDHQRPTWEKLRKAHVAFPTQPAGTGEGRPGRSRPQANAGNPVRPTAPTDSSRKPTPSSTRSMR